MECSTSLLGITFEISDESEPTVVQYINVVEEKRPLQFWTFPGKALLDRITDGAHIIETRTESYRFRQTLEKRKRQNSNANSNTASPPTDGGGKQGT